MKTIGGKRRKRLGVGVAVVAAMAGGVGCGPVDFDSESVAETQEAAGPISITTWDGLVAMGSTGSYRLDANLSGLNKTWVPKSFSGTFDGNGRTISNLTINQAGDVGFFVSLNGATVKNLKLTSLSVTGGWTVGGVAGYVENSTLERIAVEGTITGTNGWAFGGIAGYMVGGTLTRSYAKGTVNGSPLYAAGGLVGGLFSQGQIFECYAQVTVAPNTSDPTRLISAGGLVGTTFAGNIYDVYAVGNVTGRGAVGGLVGFLDGDEFNPWMLYKGMSRGGDVVDKNKAGGWEGTIGNLVDHQARFTMLHFDNQADPTSGPNTSFPTTAQEGHSTNDMKTPTAPAGGVFCAQDDAIPERCGDNTFFDPPWNPGSASQHHTLRNMPGPNVQPTQ